ncbi:hypothetical protein ABID56_001987 [Alkalibacillus flavidus]|uniref:DUF3298 domain-containing protein n=1 Tax=Alkalibacillus flavidus TaxID=546021 RepID=A0ABV2KWA5_9BACI
MKQKPFRYFLLALAISYIVGLVLFAPNNEESQSVHAVLEDGETDHTTYPDIQLRTISKQESDYTLYVQTPVFQSDSLNQFFGDYVEQVMNQFFHGVDVRKRLDDDVPADLKLTVELGEAGQGLYAVRFHEESYTGGATIKQSVKSWMVDLDAGELLDRETLFSDVDAAKDQAFALIDKQLKTSEQYQDYLLEAELDGWLAQTDYHFTNMYIDDGQVVFHFNPYQVASGAAGMPEVIVPIQQFESLIKEKWLDRLEIDDEAGFDFYM